MSWEHRAHRRVLTVVPVLIFGELFHAKGDIVNLSRDGCVIAVAQAPEKGQHLHLLIQMPKRDTSIEIQLAIVRWNALGLFGVEFVRVNALHQTSLELYLSMMDACPSLGKLVHLEDTSEKGQPQRQVVA
ncbi:MAG: PilZ domain-containing protein [Nitrospirae bacterium]|nr:PilZ domain-containing protein [Nitrospirota bacterium]